MTETCQLALLNIDAATKCISFSDKALNCARRGEEKALNVLDGIQLVDLSGLLRCFAHHADAMGCTFLLRYTTRADPFSSRYTVNAN